MMDIYTEIDLKQRIKDAIENGTELNTFINEIGWEDWMQAYTDKQENNGEELTIGQIEAINNDIKELWDKTKAEMPLRLFKVYAQNIRGKKHITMIPEYDEESVINEAVDGVYNDASNYENFDIFKDDNPDELDDDKINEAFSAIKDYFNENGILNAGDYQIVKAYGEGCVSIPCMCGYDTTFIFDL